MIMKIAAFERIFILSTPISPPSRGIESAAKRLPRLRNHVDHVWFTAFHRIQPALERRGQFGWIGDRSFRCHAITRRHLRVIDKGISEARANMSSIPAAAANAAHVLDEHEFLMPCTIVMHDGQHRKLVMDGRPKHTGRVVEITITLDIDHDAIAALCRQRSADGCGSAIAHAARPLTAEIAVRLIVIPKLDMMTTGKTARRCEAPVFVLDQWP